MDNLIIKFENEDRCFTLDNNTYELYDKSIFVLVKRFNKINEITLKDITYDDFLPIYNFLITNNRNIIIKNKELFDYCGICSPEINLLLEVNSKLKQKRKDKLNKLNEFLDGKDKLLIFKSYEKYNSYKNTLKDNQNIVPIQIITNRDTCSLLCAYNTIPIYNKFTKWLSTETFASTTDNYDIPEIRLQMLKLFLKGINKFKNGIVLDINYILHKHKSMLETSNESEFILEFVDLYHDAVEFKNAIYEKYYDAYPSYGINRTIYNFNINKNKLNNTIDRLNNIDINTQLNFKKSDNLIEGINVYFALFNQSQ